MRPVYSILLAGLAVSAAPAAIAQAESVSVSANAPMTLDDFAQALRSATGRPVLVGLTAEKAYLRNDRNHLLKVKWTGDLEALLNGVTPRYGVQWARENDAILLFDDASARPKAPPPPPAPTPVKAVEIPASASAPQAVAAAPTPPFVSAPVVQGATAAVAPSPAPAPAARPDQFAQSMAPFFQQAPQPAYAAPAPAYPYAAPPPAPAYQPSPAYAYAAPGYAQPAYAAPAYPAQAYSAPAQEPAYEAPRPLNRFIDPGMPPVVSSDRPIAPAPRPFVDTPPRAKRSYGQVNMVSTDRSRLDAKEAYGVQLANEWKSNPDKPRQGEDGSVKYLYGATMPTMVCSPLEVCAIQLQPGEVVNDLHAGDTARWRITPANSGKDGGTTTLVIVKPTDAGLETNLFISTDRRTYSIRLKSTQSSWIPLLSFDYPDDVQAEWAQFRKRQEKVEVATTLPATGQNITNLDFNFKISGDRPRWQPARVYTDGSKTYIQFANAKFNDEAPALVALGAGGGLFSSPATEMINYRVVGDMYVVDQVIDRAALIAGVGREQARVVIEHKAR